MAASIRVHTTVTARCMNLNSNFTPLFCSKLNNSTNLKRVQGLGRCLHTRPLPRHTPRQTVCSSRLRIFHQNNPSLHRFPFVVTSHRFNSTQTHSDIAETLSTSHYDPSYLPPPPSLPIPEQIDISETLNVLGEPSLSSLGLCNYTPPGLVQYVLEALHVTCDVPWWGAIGIGVLCLRAMIYPIQIIAMRHQIRFSNIFPEYMALTQKFNDARYSNNLMEAARLAAELNEFTRKNDISAYKQFIMPMVQLPIFMSVFIGLRGMVSLPVESLKEGGLLWFTDLTLADPFYILPIVSMATMSLVIEIGAEGFSTSQVTPFMRYFMRAMPAIGLLFVSHFPATGSLISTSQVTPFMRYFVGAMPAIGLLFVSHFCAAMLVYWCTSNFISLLQAAFLKAMLVYWCTSNFISLLQAAFLKVPGVKKKLKLPEKLKHDKSAVSKPGFVQGFKDSLENSRMLAELQNREKADAMQFRKAGTGPLTKTYKYDPGLPRPESQIGASRGASQTGASQIGASRSTSQSSVPRRPDK